VQDHRCLSGGRNDSIHLEWRWLEDGRADVRYAGQRERLPLHRISMETTVLAEDRPYQFDSVWEERIDGRLNGRYLLSTQGALVLDLRYERARDGRAPPSTMTRPGRKTAAAGRQGGRVSTIDDDTLLERSWEYREETLYRRLFGDTGPGIYLDMDLLRNVFKQEQIDPRWLHVGVNACPPHGDRRHWIYVSTGLSNPWKGGTKMEIRGGASN
jgi:hypothetical protein